MQVRQSIPSDYAKIFDTGQLREQFLVETIFLDGEITMTYSHIDRIIVGGIVPIEAPLGLVDDYGAKLGVAYFLERRELGVVNIGGPGTVTVDGEDTQLDREEALYVGMGARAGLVCERRCEEPGKVLLQQRAGAPGLSQQEDHQGGSDNGEPWRQGLLQRTHAS